MSAKVAVPYVPLSRDGYSRPGGAPSAWRLRFRHVAAATLSLPLTGFIFCVCWSLRYNFAAATATHCEVANYLPSISAAIGSFRVQRRVWRWAIALQAPGRFVAGFLYHQHWLLTLQLTSGRRALLLLAQILYVSEQLGLLGLSFVASVDNFPFHKTAFITFLVCSETYMLLTCLLCRAPRLRSAPRLQRRSRRLKFGLFAANLCSLVFCVYFYWRHNALCEPGMYTLFALSEYSVVLCNIGFHGTAYWDFYDKAFDLSVFAAS